MAFLIGDGNEDPPSDSLSLPAIIAKDQKMLCDIDGMNCLSVRNGKMTELSSWALDQTLCANYGGLYVDRDTRDWSNGMKSASLWKALDWYGSPFRGSKRCSCLTGNKDTKDGDCKAGLVWLPLSGVEAVLVLDWEQRYKR